MSAGRLVALDWGHPAVENLESREGEDGIACIWRALTAGLQAKLS